MFMQRLAYFYHALRAGKLLSHQFAHCFLEFIEHCAVGYRQLMQHKFSAGFLLMGVTRRRPTVSVQNAIRILQ